MKAYEIQSKTQKAGGIIYAESNTSARRQGAVKYGNGHWDSVSCKRANWADEFKGQYISKAMLSRHGIPVKLTWFERFFGKFK